VTRAGLEGKPEEAIRVAASQFDPPLSNQSAPQPSIPAVNPRSGPVADELGAAEGVPPWKKSPTRSAGSAPACTVDLHGQQTPGANGRFHGL